MQYFLDGKSSANVIGCFSGNVISYGMDGGLLTRYPGYFLIFNDGSGRLFDVTDRYMRVDPSGRISHQKPFDEQNTNPLELMKFPLLKHSWKRETHGAPESIATSDSKFDWLCRQYFGEGDILRPLPANLRAFRFLRAIERDGRYIYGWEFIGELSDAALSLIDY